METTQTIDISTEPVISAIVTTYNRANLLARALDSILAQTYRDFELIVVHDGPLDDATKAIYEAYEARFDAAAITARFVATDENSGYQCVPKNWGTYLARGTYIAYLDDDNEWTPQHLELLFNAIEEGENWPDFTYGRREYVHDEGAPSGLCVGPSPHRPFEESVALLQNATTNFIDTSDALFAKGALWRAELATGHIWNEGLRRFGDWELVTRGVYFAGWRGKAVDAIVQRYHWHTENLQHTRPLNEVPSFNRPEASHK